MKPHLHWKLKLTSGMYGDLALDCATPGCEFTCYTSAWAVWFWKLLGG